MTDLVESYRLNVVAAFLCSTTAVPTMRRRGGGAIVNISSMATERFGGLLSVYGANKAALEHLTRSMAGQFAPAIRVNAISPGPIESAKMKGARPNWPAERQEALVQAIALGRLGTSEDVAHGVLFLVSPLASWITGVVLPIHGGKGLVSDLPS
jgi:7-alpha-hydroxysteroid dehydrogenase